MNKSAISKDTTNNKLIKYSEDLKENILNEIQTFQNILSIPTGSNSNKTINYNASPEDSPQNDSKLSPFNSKSSQELELHKAKCLLKIQNILYCINEHFNE